MGRRARAAAVAVVLAGCGTPAVSLPVADPAGAPSTLAPPASTIAPGITVPPGVTLPPGVTVAPATTPAPATTLAVVEPPEPLMRVDQITPAVWTVAAARGGEPRLWSVVVTPEAVELSVADGDTAVGYRYVDGVLEGPLPATPPGTGLVPFAPGDIDQAGALRAYDFVATFVGGTAVNQVAGIGTPAGTLWLVTAFRPGGSAVSAVFDAAGNLQDLRG